MINPPDAKMPTPDSADPFANMTGFIAMGNMQLLYQQGITKGKHPSYRSLTFLHPILTFQVLGDRLHNFVMF